MFSFLRQVLTNYHTTGAVFPSSRRLALAMTRLIRAAPSPRRILEVGPGTGAFTKVLLGALRSGDELHVVEINPRFADSLRRDVLESFQARRPDVTIALHVGAIERVELEGGFDFIICGLPFNNFPLVKVREIFRVMLDRLKTGGVLTYFEYLGMRAIKVPINGPRGWKRLRWRAAHVKAFDRRYSAQRDLILWNITPAYAIHLKG